MHCGHLYECMTMTKNVSNMLASAEQIKEICHPDVKLKVVSLYESRNLFNVPMYQCLCAFRNLAEYIQN